MTLKRLRLPLLVVLIGAAAWGVYAYMNRPPSSLVLTGIVTANDVIVSPQIAGQLSRLLVKEGD
jgi:multidrug efflux pump subunit AcrA (membrane-fusion protein)